MKNKGQASSSSRFIRPVQIWTLIVASLFAAPSLFAASQTWSNAPVDATWTNIHNWVGLAVPGDINNATANNVNADVATFNTPLFSGIGGSANPIVPDDATL